MLYTCLYSTCNTLFCQFLNYIIQLLRNLYLKKIWNITSAICMPTLGQFCKFLSLGYIIYIAIYSCCINFLFFYWRCFTPLLLDLHLDSVQVWKSQELITRRKNLGLQYGLFKGDDHMYQNIKVTHNECRVCESKDLPIVQISEIWPLAHVPVCMYNKIRAVSRIE